MLISSRKGGKLVVLASGESKGKGHLSQNLKGNNALTCQICECENCVKSFVEEI